MTLRAAGRLAALDTRAAEPELARLAAAARGIEDDARALGPNRSGYTHQRSSCLKASRSRPRRLGRDRELPARGSNVTVGSLVLDHPNFG
jgi:hypothetical protein